MIATGQPTETTMATTADQVFRYLRSLVGDSEAARDLTQETVLRLVGQVQPSPAFVFTVARNCGLSYLRHRRVARRVEQGIVDPGLADTISAPEAARPDRDFERRQLQDDLVAAMATLPEDQRTVFHLTEIEGLRYDAVAAVLGIPPGTVASRKHHAVRKLQDEMRRRGYDA
jgi:RNA polymerase sigma-70 factor, ECF subfamily